MKKVLLIMFMFFSASLYSQEKIFENFKLGVDNYESICKTVGVDKFSDNDNNIEYDGVIETVDIKYDSFSDGSIILRLINDKLFAIKFYPKNDKIFYKYQNSFNKKYKTKMLDRVWFTSKMLIVYDMNKDYKESFIYYDINLLDKYSKYKYF